MSEANGNGQIERSYFCRGCGRWLFETTVALGTHGTVHLKCPETRCGRMNLVKVGEEPLPRPDRDRWIAEIQRRRPRATTF
ncbi:MAG TPA: hypothetical protein VGJ60_07765 [Chloroflexota bacterium]|jgi:hypothetical protein